MTRGKKKAYKIALWLIRYFRAEGRLIQEMRSVSEIKAGHIYSHYGRIIVPELMEQACDQCELQAHGLPCGNCEQKYKWTILETHSQNATSQKMYQRLTAQRLGYK